MSSRARWWALGCLAAVVAVGVLVTTAPAARAAPAGATVSAERVDRAVAFLLAHQQVDGGFAESGSASDSTLTAWVTLALDAADVETAELRRGGSTLAQYLLAQSPTDVTEVELQILARTASRLDATALVTSLQTEVRRGGRIGPRLNSTIWGILALRGAGRPVPKEAVRYLRRNQSADGGFSWIAGGAPDTNDTAAAIQALRAVGVAPNAKPLRRAFRYLAATRRTSGGFPLVGGGAADAQSTGWVLQAYASTGRAGPAKSRRYLVRLQQTAGSFAYKRGREITPVWVTAQSLPGLIQAAFPAQP